MIQKYTGRRAVGILSILFSIALPASFAHAGFALEDIGECYAAVEAYDAEIEQSSIPAESLKPLENTLGQAITACEAGDLAQGGALLTKAGTLFDALWEEQPQGLTEGEFWQAADYAWGNKSYAKGVAFMNVKVNEDDSEDIIGWRLNLDSPEGVFFDVLAVVKNADGAIQTAFTSLPYGTNDMLSLCGIEGDYQAPEITQTQWSVEETASMGVAVPPYSIRIDDGMCDALYLFWPSNTSTKEVDFVVHRN